MYRLDNIQKQLSQSPVYDYIIVGGGISGLQAAQILSKKTKNILILEAQDKLGGRIETLSVTDLPAAKSVGWILENQDHFAKVKIQKGATWIEERHQVLKEICKLYNIPMKVQFSEGNAIFLTKEQSFTQEQLLQIEEYAQGIKKFLSQIDKLADEYNRKVLNSVDYSNEAADMIRIYDSMTLSQYLQNTIANKKARDFIENFLEHTQCVSGDINSMHEVLTKHARSNDIGIMKQFLGLGDSHQPSYVLDGTDILIRKYVQSLEKCYQKSIQKLVRFDCQVIQIDNFKQNVATVTGFSKFGKVSNFQARKVICAVPLQLLRSITFTNISQHKKLVFDNQIRTNAVKTFAVFQKPFWRDNNLTGDGLFSYDWMVNMCHDISPQDQSCGILVFFHNGKKYQKWKNMFSHNKKEAYVQKKQYMIKMIAKMFKISENSSQFIEYFSKMFIGQSSFMQNPFIRSGFQSNTRPGTFSQIVNLGGNLNALYGDEQNVIFIGSQFSDSFASYIEGAIRVSRKKLFKEINEQDPLKIQQQSINSVYKSH